MEIAGEAKRQRQSPMGIMNIASLSFGAVAIGVVACVMIYRRKKQQAQSATEKLRWEAEEAQCRIEDESRREEEELKKSEEKPEWLEEEARRKAEEEQRRRVEQEQDAVWRAEEDEWQRLGTERRQRGIEEAQWKAEAQHQTEELQKAEEAHSKAQEEQAHGEAEEAQRKAEEEARPKAKESRAAGGERRRTKEEHKGLEGESRLKREEARRKGKEEKRPRAEKTERKRLEPGKRGGRPRDTAQDCETQPPRETKSRRPKPEIVCWKRERQWILGVEIPEELLENSGLVVLQNASPLSQDGYKEGCWRLEQAFSEVMVHGNEGENVRESKIALGEENYLLFKLSGQNQNQGRHVKSASSGSYLVMVPDNWERDDAVSGPPPTVPEPLSLTGHKAHFFDLEKGSGKKIAFCTPGGKLEIESEASRFELVGTRLLGANQNIGPLFGKEPPQIHALDDQAWKDVGTIVIGEEGGRKPGWRTQFSPVPQGRDANLPSEVTAKKGGWYFLRFYDTNDDLIESLDFRFICALKEIRILQSSPFPSEDGYRPVHVEFLYEPDCAVQPAGTFARSIQIEREDKKTILTIPPDPACDETHWRVGSEDGLPVEVDILIERLWWVVGEEDSTPSEWKDARVTLSRDDFVATSNKAVWVRLPKPCWTDAVRVGFEQSKARRYPSKVTENKIAIPLRDFGDSQEVGDRAQEHLFNVWIRGDNGLDGGVIAIIPAQHPPRKRLFLNLATISAPRLTTVLTSLRRVTSGPLSALIKEVRRAYPRAHAACRAESVEFVKNALCMIALVLELQGEERSRILSLKKHWCTKARLARDEFPEIMGRLWDRYKDINTSRADRVGNLRNKRYVE